MSDSESEKKRTSKHRGYAFLGTCNPKSWRPHWFCRMLFILVLLMFAIIIISVFVSFWKPLGIFNAKTYTVGTSNKNQSPILLILLVLGTGLLSASVLVCLLATTVLLPHGCHLEKIFWWFLPLFATALGVGAGAFWLVHKFVTAAIVAFCFSGAIVLCLLLLCWGHKGPHPMAVVFKRSAYLVYTSMSMLSRGRAWWSFAVSLCAALVTASILFVWLIAQITLMSAVFTDQVAQKSKQHTNTETNRDQQVNRRDIPTADMHNKIFINFSYCSFIVLIPCAIWILRVLHYSTEYVVSLMISRQLWHSVAILRTSNDSKTLKEPRYEPPDAQSRRLLLLRVTWSDLGYLAYGGFISLAALVLGACSSLTSNGRLHAEYVHRNGNRKGLFYWRSVVKSTNVYGFSLLALYGTGRTPSKVASKQYNEKASTQTGELTQEEPYHELAAEAKKNIDDSLVDVIGKSTWIRPALSLMTLVTACICAIVAFTYLRLTNPLYAQRQPHTVAFASVIAFVVGAELCLILTSPIQAAIDTLFVFWSTNIRGLDKSDREHLLKQIADNFVGHGGRDPVIEARFSHRVIQSRLEDFYIDYDLRGAGSTYVKTGWYMADTVLCTADHEEEIWVNGIERPTKPDQSTQHVYHTIVVPNAAPPSDTYGVGGGPYQQASHQLSQTDLTQPHATHQTVHHTVVAQAPGTQELSLDAPQSQAEIGGQHTY